MSGAVLYRDRWSATAHLVSPDPRRPGKWRASRFDDRGPSGHSDAGTRADAIRIAREHGADMATGREVTAETVDAVAVALGCVVGTADVGGGSGASG